MHKFATLIMTGCRLIMTGVHEGEVQYADIVNNIKSADMKINNILANEFSCCNCCNSMCIALAKLNINVTINLHFEMLANPIKECFLYYHFLTL